ncbi:uncharacterized protein LJ264_011112 [Porphyrio hochstetteri]
MDHPRFTQLCFLILITAAPCPKTAKASENHAGGTQGSSSSKTNVTVYHCEDCESTICNSPDYERFVRVAETPNGKFSNKTIQLETNDTHISMCFQNTSTKGVCAIFWEKTGGMGDSCGSISDSVENEILMNKYCASLQASSENLRCHITRICCVAETNLSKPNPLLSCYTEIASKTPSEPPTNVTGIALKVTDVHEENSMSIIVPVMILGVCVIAAAAFYVLQKRNGQGHVFVLQQVFNAVKKTGEGPEVENFA